MRWIGRIGFAVFPRWLAWRWWQPWHRWNSIRLLRIGPFVIALSDGPA